MFASLGVGELWLSYLHLFCNFGLIYVPNIKLAFTLFFSEGIINRYQYPGSVNVKKNYL